MKNKLNSLLKWGAVAGVAVSPFVVFAQSVQDTCSDVYTTTTLASILCKLSVLLNTVIPVLIVLGVIYFIWGVITYVIAGEDEAKTKGRNMMIYGLIGLLVIVSVWGLVNILRNSFGIYGTAPINVPCIEAPGVECP
jgi:hypothetical protein